MLVSKRTTERGKTQRVRSGGGTAGKRALKRAGGGEASGVRKRDEGGGFGAVIRFRWLIQDEGDEVCKSTEHLRKSNKTLAAAAAAAAAIGAWTESDT
jgi:hypothetical protein